MLKNTITQSELKSILSYSPITGHFTWIIKPSNQSKYKDHAGSLSEHQYIRIWVGGKHYMAHRLAFLYMTGEFPKEIDHINHIRNDNRWSNLRVVTRCINMQNKSIYKNNKTGVIGVTFDKKGGVYVARIQVKNKSVHLGSYTKVEDAISARVSANKTYGFHKNHGNT